jgi:uncharacterized protein (DUF486 family)
MVPIFLLVVSNVFMTIAWYGHLKHTYYPLWKVVLFSWLIAFVEYCFQVPANRLGYARFSAFELKTVQEVVNLSVFVIFAVVYLKEEVKWNYLVGFGLMVAAVFFVFKKWD